MSKPVTNAAKKATAAPAKTTETKKTAAPAKEAKPAKVKGQTIGSFALDCMKKGLDNKATLDAVKAKYPDAKTGMASINWYRNKAVSEGVAGVRGSREITSEALAVKKAADKKIKDAEKAKAEKEKATAEKTKKAEEKAKGMTTPTKGTDKKVTKPAAKPAATKPASSSSALD